MKSKNILSPVKSNIHDFYKKGFCMGCGICAGVCPPDNTIVMKINNDGFYEPKVNHQTCVECNLCLDLCPGDKIDYIDLNKFTFNINYKNLLNSNLKYIGHTINVFIGKSKNQSIRYNASSGGIVTSLLCYMLDSKIIDAALVAKMDENDPLHGKIFLAKSSDEIRQSSKSKYCPISWDNGIREILRNNGKYAVVGLPCQIAGLRMAQKKMPKLNKRIIYSFGLVCNHIPSYNATEFFLKKLHIEKEEVENFGWRGYGWPGHIWIKLKNKKKLGIPRGMDNKNPLRIPYNSAFHFDFWNPRCMSCTDGAAELADISFADPYLPEYRSDKIGKTILAVRNTKSLQLIKDAVSKKYLELDEVDIDKFYQSQKIMLLKKKVTGPKKAFSRLLRFNYPKYHHYEIKNNNAGISKLFSIALLYIHHFANRNRFLKHLKIPMAKLRLKLFDNLGFKHF